MNFCRSLRKEKLDVLDEINNIIKVDYDVTRDLFKNYLIKTGTFNEEQFEEKLKTVINSNPRLEDDTRITR